MIKGFKDFERKIRKAQYEFIDQGVKVPRQVNKILFDGGNDIRSAIIRRMQSTKKAPWSYARGRKRYHPSMPGGYPAIDSGRLKSDISFNVRRGLRLEIGSSLDYAEKLENRKDKSKRRPWLEHTVIQFSEDIIFDISQVIPRAIENVMIKL